MRMFYTGLLFGMLAFSAIGCGGPEKNAPRMWWNDYTRAEMSEFEKPPAPLADETVYERTKKSDRKARQEEEKQLARDHDWTAP